MPNSRFPETRIRGEIKDYTYPRQHLVPLVNELPNVGDDPCSYFLQFLSPKVGVADAHLVQSFRFLNLRVTRHGAKEDKVTGTGGKMP